MNDSDSSERVVIDFADPAGPSWREVTDAVMGGVSQVGFSQSADGSGILEGHLSLENNGGFASIRTKLGRLDLSAFQGLSLRVRGYGQSYRLRVRIDDERDGIAYQARFETAEGGWQVARVPFASLVPTYRGRTVEDAPPFDPAQIRQIGFMIADKQEGPFRLEIAWVHAYS